MPKVHKRKARADIYRIGLRTENKKNKRGYTLDRSKPADKDDVIIVKKGQEYFTWTHYQSAPSFSLTPPTKRDLTRSEYQLALYDLEDEQSDISADSPEDLESAVEQFKENIQNLLDEQEQKISNLEEHNLQEAPVGQMIAERRDALQSAVDELDGLDLEYSEPDEEELRQAVIEEVSDDVGADRQEGGNAELPDFETYITEEMISDKREEKLREWLDEKIEEIQGVSFES